MVKPSQTRNYDAVYDTVYTVSDTKDAYRSMPQPKLQKLPVYSNMFSDTQMFQYKMASVEQSLKTPMLPPTSHVASGKNMHVDVGAERWKFIKRPLLAKPSFAKLDPEVTQPMVATTTITTTAAPEQQGGKQDAFTQSDYRENEVQTDPFEPNINVIKHHMDDPDPEVLLYAKALRIQDGTLPAKFDAQGIRELQQNPIEIIDRIRRRKQVEDALPQTVADAAEFEQRCQALKDLELQERQEKEQFMIEEQERKLQYLKETLDFREGARDEQNTQRLNSFTKRRIMDELQHKMNHIEQKRRKQIRKVTQKYDNPEQKLQRKDLIQEYSFLASRTYAPMKREGIVEQQQQQPVPTSLTATNYKINNNMVKEVKPALLTVTYGIDQVAQHSKTWKQAIKPIAMPALPQHITVPVQHVDKAQAIQTLRELYRATPRLVRPSTPTLDPSTIVNAESDDATPNDEMDNTNVDYDDDRYATVLLQQVLRGRAIQEEWYQGKQRTLSLIQELLHVATNTTTLDTTNTLAPTAVNNDTNNFYEHVQGAVVSRTLEFLAHTLVRQETAQVYDALMQKAEDERTKREAAELAQRKVELAQLNKHKYVFDQVMQCHDETIHVTMQEWTRRAIDHVATHVALQQTKEAELEPLEADEHALKRYLRRFLFPHVQKSMSTS